MSSSSTTFQSTQQLDNQVEIVTPENIALHYQLAGPFRRLCAYILDMLIRLAILVAVGFVVAILGLGALFGAGGLAGMGAGLFLIVMFLLEWFYGGLFEALWNGQTPGKRLLGIRVLSTRGQPINAWQAIMRNVLRLADAMPVLGPIPTYQLGMLVMISNSRFQRIGDLLCRTIVVVEESPPLYGVVRITDPRAIELAESLPPRFKASRSLSLALSTYVQRRLAFSERRRAEIASHLSQPLCARWGLSTATDGDLLLCALYYRIFITDRAEEQQAQNPFTRQPPPSGFVTAEAVEMEVPLFMSRPKPILSPGETVEIKP